ncbi:MAG: mannonate dehydratase [bacterium]|nr:mannonate dehydratase [bacterium]
MAYKLRAVPGFEASTPGIQLAAQTNDKASDEDLQFIQQLGVEWVMVSVGDDNDQNADYYKHLKARFAQYDLQIYRIGNHSVHNMPEVTLNLPGRDEKVEEFATFIRNLGEAGIPYNTYAHMGNGIWSSGHTTRRGGMQARTLDIKNATGNWIGKKFEGELTHGRLYTEDELWDNYAYMIKHITPVAEAAGVFIGIHPDDPPVYALGGVPRCIFGNFDGYKRAMEIADSPNIGVCLCIGCWLEGGEQNMGVNVPGAIRYFAERRKLFKVHFRNVTNPMPEPWTETLMDDGYMDMHVVMKTLRDVGYDGAIIPDHIPALLGGHRAGVAYSIAYMRALVQSVNNEAGGPGPN